MQLIGMLDSPYVRRVAISMKLMGIPFEHQSVSVFRNFDRFREINPVVKAPTLVCDDGTVNISGVNNTIEVQGACTMVTVSGVENTVTVESADTISASGFDNRVTYRTGTPEISKSGRGNVVEPG